jgi:MFS family permease
VVKQAIIAKWFKGKELAFAFGLNLTFARLGPVTAGILSPRVAENHGLNASLWVSIVFVGLAWLCGIGVVLCERYADTHDAVDKRESAKFKCRDLSQFSLPFWLLVFSCVSIYCSIFPYTWNTA